MGPFARWATSSATSAASGCRSPDRDSETGTGKRDGLPSAPSGPGASVPVASAATGQPSGASLVVHRRGERDGQLGFSSRAWVWPVAISRALATICPLSLMPVADWIWKPDPAGMRVLRFCMVPPLSMNGPPTITPLSLTAAGEKLPPRLVTVPSLHSAPSEAPVLVCDVPTT